MKLCARFYDPQQGHLFFNGVPMDEIAPESLMSHISMVFQDVCLFQDTIRNNIRFGKTDAMDEEIIAAAKKACCHDFINALAAGIRHDGRRRWLYTFWWGKATYIHRTCYAERRTNHFAGRSDRLA